MGFSPHDVGHSRRGWVLGREPEQGGRAAVGRAQTPIPPHPSPPADLMVPPFSLQHGEQLLRAVRTEGGGGRALQVSRVTVPGARSPRTSWGGWQGTVLVCIESL